MVLSLNGVDLGCMNPITGSNCRAKCSNISHDSLMFAVKARAYPCEAPFSVPLLGKLYNIKYGFGNKLACLSKLVCFVTDNRKGTSLL